jgi:hypothetical protein
MGAYINTPTQIAQILLEGGASQKMKASNLPIEEKILSGIA